MRKWQSSIALIVAVALNFLFFNLVWAYAHLKSADVAPGAILTDAPDSITLTFNEPSDLQQTAIHVFDTQGIDVNPQAEGEDAAKSVIPRSSDATTWTVFLLSGEPDGVYLVKYHTLSDSDGGIVEGSYNFTVARNGTAVSGDVSTVVEKVSGGKVMAPGAGLGGNATATPNRNFLVACLTILVVGSGIFVWWHKEKVRKN